ncbi:MAG: transglycosylase SLT domain-containing protein [Deltaproteobacteria bacterium]|nr:transglycosylase SLT domain-containing protein [Deltaproteobacteria bacterium]
MQRGRLLLPVLAYAQVALALVLLVGFVACTGAPPAESVQDDLCELFDARKKWRKAAVKARKKWNVPEPVLMAIVHQESRFNARARPRRRYVLGVIPRPRSSAYGYGQAKDGTWKEYQSKTGQRGAERDDFGDVADFIGWYADVIRKSTGIAVSDTYRLYLAYHEGPTGYRRGSYKDKAWLQGVAHKVSLRAERYARQYADCGG